VLADHGGGAIEHDTEICERDAMLAGKAAGAFLVAAGRPAVAVLQA